MTDENAGDEEKTDMREKGERHSGRGNNKKLASNDATPKLPDLGITRDQSSQWQQLAEIAKREVETYIAAVEEKTANQVDVVRKAKQLLVSNPSWCKELDLPVHGGPANPRGRGRLPGEQHEHGSVSCILAFLGEKNWSHTQLKAGIILIVRLPSFSALRCNSDARASAPRFQVRRRPCVDAFDCWSKRLIVLDRKATGGLLLEHKERRAA